ncbi:MAG: SGNH/GDSL hydrolase family protein [Planctomycetota bacterium]|nr:SGNH/GDSL hydrolase family protein [Planctomycetota bacterium]
MKLAGYCFFFLALASFSMLPAQELPQGPYTYEVKPDNPAFKSFNPRKAPAPDGLLLKEGDRLAICGDSITEQKMYSRLMETYLTACVPDLKVTVRQYGWSGEKTDGFLRRMDRDCLTFQPTIATLAYGMNDSRYRPFDITNGRWYRDHYTAIVRRFKEHGTRVVVGSPGCAGKIATWVQSRSGTLEQHNLHLCALRDIAIEVADAEEVGFADIFWPMYQAQVLAPQRFNVTPESLYEVAGRDGIHPGWAGQVIMAWSMLRSLGLDGELGTLEIDLTRNMAKVTDGHHLTRVDNDQFTFTSDRYPFCARGDLADDNSIRSGTTLIPFHQDLNRLILKVTTPKKGRYRVHWGEHVREYTTEQLSDGINLAADYVENPFCDAFDRVFDAVGKKQAYETIQVKKVFHSREAREDFNAVIQKTEAERKPLAEAVRNSLRPVTHTLTFERIAP